MFSKSRNPHSRAFFVFVGLAAGAAALSNMPATADDKALTQLPIVLAQVTGGAPEFVGLNKWFNSTPLRMADLRGKVVLVNFWTYGCVNCVRTLPHVVKLQEKYGDKGLVIVGIHTPEFPFEKSATNVETALKRHGITYSVAQDNDSATWNAYRNRYWPAQYIVDQTGKIVFQHDGEGQYDTIDRTIQKLLNSSG
jgi:thiol-disulfide isomerase/thioredoxin